jgi:arylsulfatase A-like enzyme
VLIVADDLGYHDLGCYGNAQIKTPRLDRLARQGVRLTNFSVAWPACTPSRGSLLTGRYPQRHGTYDMFRNDTVDYGHRFDAAEYAVSPEMILGMDEREVLLPQVLRQVGYRNGIFGKWDLGQLRRFLPLARGFDDFYGFANTGIDYWTHARYGVPSMRSGNTLTAADKGQYTTDLFTREALRFLRENKQRPFFLYVPFNAPHIASSLEPGARGWVQAPPEYVRQYPPAENEKQQKRTSYMAAITCMDDAIGRILDFLDEHHLAHDTLVMFLSDNGGGGPADNAPLRGRKGDVFEGGVRVPCLVRWPARIPAGGTVDGFLTALDIFPTLVSAAGAAPPPGVVLDGHDMLATLTGRSPAPRREMFWQRREYRAARIGHWKWVQSRRGGGLFDLQQDVGEEHDRSADQPEVLAMVKSRFAAWQQAMHQAEPRGPFRDY